MRKNFIISFLLISFINIQAQTFVCTDINYYGSDLNPQKVQKEKAKYLGSKATLTFYDKSLKLSMDEGGRIETVVLDKINNSEYQTTEKRGDNFRKMVIKLNKWVEYIRSFKVEVYNNYNLAINVTYKRD